MGIRSLDGLKYDEKPGYGRADCLLCGHTTRMEARTRPKPRQRYRPGAPICGLCWEDEDGDRIVASVWLAEGPKDSDGNPVSF